MFSHSRENASGVELIEWIELSNRQRLTFGRDRCQCRLDAVGEADSTIVLRTLMFVSVMASSPRKIAYRDTRTKAGLVGCIVVPCSNFAIKAANAFGCSCVVR